MSDHINRAFLKALVKTVLDNEKVRQKNSHKICLQFKNRHYKKKRVVNSLMRTSKKILFITVQKHTLETSTRVLLTTPCLKKQPS